AGAGLLPSGDVQAAVKRTAGMASMALAWRGLGGAGCTDPSKYAGRASGHGHSGVFRPPEPDRYPLACRARLSDPGPGGRGPLDWGRAGRPERSRGLVCPATPGIAITLCDGASLGITRPPHTPGGKASLLGPWHGGDHWYGYRGFLLGRYATPSAPG